MNAEHFFLFKQAKFCRFLPRLTTPSLCWVLALWLLAACAPLKQPPPPDLRYPTRVITQDGLAFMVYRLKLPGTRQELTIRYNRAKQWLPLNLIQFLRFTGPVWENYRPGEITLISGESMQGEVYVTNVIVEGSTDLGYWNMPLVRVESLFMGQD
jgi:hypothetical protein